MGTNYYYLETNSKYYESDISHLIEPKYTQRHIGKSSGGWHFSLHVYPGDGINTLDDWIKLFKKGNLIIDEDSRVISYTKMIRIITERKRDINWEELEERLGNPINEGIYKNLDQFLQMNSAKKGLNNLLAHRVDGRHCIGNGDGTYDYIIGDFF